MTPPLSVLHVLNLDTIGGVESLYIEFIQKVLSQEIATAAVHHTLISGKRCHPHYHNIFSKNGHRPFHELYISRLKIPKMLRWIVDVRRGMIESVIKGPSRWVFWNRIEDRSCPDDAVYYEHGASWMVEPTEKRKEFIADMKKIIVNSKAAKTLVSHLWSVPQDQITLVENPLRSDIRICERPRKRPEGQITLGYIGRLTPIKAPGLILHTLQELRTTYKLDAILKIAGEGPEKDFIVQKSKSMGLSEHIQLVGRVENIEQFYDSIDFLLIPSVREPLGLVALEASARGVPIIASHVDGLAESVANHTSGILIKPSIPLESAVSEFMKSGSGLPRIVVDPENQTIVPPQCIDPSLLASSINRALAEEGLYERLSQGGLEHAASKTTVDQYVTSLLHEICDMPYLVEADDQEDQEKEESS